MAVLGSGWLGLKTLLSLIWLHVFLLGDFELVGWLGGLLGFYESGTRVSVSILPTNDWFHPVSISKTNSDLKHAFNHLFFSVAFFRPVWTPGPDQYCCRETHLNSDQHKNWGSCKYEYMQCELSLVNDGFTSTINQTWETKTWNSEIIFPVNLTRQSNCSCTTTPRLVFWLLYENYLYAVVLAHCNCRSLLNFSLRV